MKTGKISESILKRSVLRQIKNHRNEVKKGAGVGEDCAFLSWEDHNIASVGMQGGLAVSTQTITLPVKKAGYWRLWQPLIIWQQQGQGRWR